MPDSTPIQKCAYFKGLQEAVRAEQLVLELDLHIVSARIAVLLGVLPCDAVPPNVGRAFNSGNGELIKFVGRAVV